MVACPLRGEKTVSSDLFKCQQLYKWKKSSFFPFAGAVERGGIEGVREGQRERERERQTDRQTDRQTNRQTI